MRMIITKGPDRVVIYLLLTVMGLFFAFPLYSMVAKSFQGFGIQTHQPVHRSGRRRADWMTYVNSFAIGLFHSAIVIVVSTTAGYALSKLQFRGRELSFAAVILFLAVPGNVLSVPVFHITSQLGLFNNYLGVALPEAALTIPFGVLLMRNYGRNIDDSLIEAAKLDGAGHFRSFGMCSYLWLARLWSTSSCFASSGLSRTSCGPRCCSPTPT